MDETGCSYSTIVRRLRKFGPHGNAIFHVGNINDLTNQEIIDRYGDVSRNGTKKVKLSEMGHMDEFSKRHGLGITRWIIVDRKPGIVIAERDAEPSDEEYVPEYREFDCDEVVSVPRYVPTHTEIEVAAVKIREGWLKDGDECSMEGTGEDGSEVFWFGADSLVWGELESDKERYAARDVVH